MANVTVAGQNYTGVNSVELPKTGEAARQKFIIPAGTVSIIANGTVDVSQYEEASVNVPAPEPNLQQKTTTPTEAAQEITPDSGYDGLAKVTVEGVSETYVGSGVARKAAEIITPGTADQVIDANQFLAGEQTIRGDGDLKAANIRAGVEIFGVTGSYGGEGVNLQEKSATPSASQQVIQPDSGYDGLSKVTVAGDADLIPGNIKSGAEIFGVAGSYSGEAPVLQEKSVTPAAVQQTVQPDDGYDGLSKVTVAGDANLAAANIKSGVAIFGVEGAYSGDAPNLQEKSITENGTYTPDIGYDGFSRITVNVPTGGGGLPSEIVAGDTPVICNAGAYQGTGTSLANTKLSMTIPIAGTYRIKWIMAGGGGSSNYSIKSQIYKNGTAQGSTITTTSTQACSIDLACAAGDVITLYFAGYNYYGTISGGCGGLCACIEWDNGF